MESLKSKPTRRSLVGRLAAGCLVAAGFAIAAVSPAMADGWGRGHGNWDHGGYYHGGGYYGGPRVVYVQPRPVVVAPVPYYAPAPAYYAPPPPPPVYYAPAPVYAAPSLNVVIPLRFH